MRRVMSLADETNEWFDAAKPWELAKSDEKADALHSICSIAINVFRLLTIYLKPVLPDLAHRAEQFLKVEPLQWRDARRVLESGHRIGAYRHLMNRIASDQIDALLEGPKAAPVAAAPAPQSRAAERRATPAPAPSSAHNSINIDDFAKVDLRIARIVAAEHVQGADKLLKLTLDIGEERPRVVFAGIKSAYDPATLVGRLTPMVANLAPRQMKFGTSEGMVLAASGNGPGVFLLSPDSGASPGMRVK
jgi:methionyl-tRNA synthetase